MGLVDSADIGPNDALYPSGAQLSHDQVRNPQMEEQAMNGLDQFQIFQQKMQAQSMVYHECYVSQLEYRLATTKTLLEASSAELTVLRSFFANMDTHSGADVTSMVESLNSEVMQTAAIIADSLRSPPLSRKAYPKRYKHPDDHNERTIQEGVLARPLVHALQKGKHEVDEIIILVQVALQACLVEATIGVVNSWHPMVPKRGKFLKEIYKKMCVSGQFKYHSL